MTDIRREAAWSSMGRDIERALLRETILEAYDKGYRAALAAADAQADTVTVPPETCANARLIVAAGNAASEVADMGYDPVEAVKALPHLPSVLQRSHRPNVQELMTVGAKRLDRRASGKEGE